MEYGNGVIAGTVAILTLLSLLEALIAKRRGIDAYEWNESLGSICLFMGHKLCDAAALGLTLWVANCAWNHRFFTLPVNHWWSITLMFFGVEFFYYWHHRLSHEVNWLWATHLVHHSAEKFNLLVSFRLGWMPIVDGVMIFFIPLALLGFQPHLLLAMFIGNKVYQFWIHSALIPRIGRFDEIFNSPANHRVHHARNPMYLNKNFGGSLIIFDRLFGTYAPEVAGSPCEYGLVHPIQSRNPLWIAINGWSEMLRAIRTKDHSLLAIWTLVVGRPGALSDLPSK